MNSHPKNCISHSIEDFFDRIYSSGILEGFYRQIELINWHFTLQAYLKEDLSPDQKLSCQIISWWLSRTIEKQRFLPLVTQLSRARENGVWALPSGGAYYTYLLNEYTTLTAEKIHEIGLQEVERIEKKIIDLLKQQGLWKQQVSIGAYLQELNKNHVFSFANTEEERELCLKKIEEIVSRAEEKLGDLFSVKPKALPIIKLVQHGEKGEGTAAYYIRSMDGSHPGTLFVNLSGPQMLPSFQMETIAIHEGVPGHHYQRSLQMESDSHILRKWFDNAAYVEGWALYAEMLAYEEGFYSSLFNQIGHLQSELRRAARLVVDTGIHWKRWSRGEAIVYMGQVVGLSPSDVDAEIECCFVTPGKACAYKIGQMKILELREEEKQRLGDQFDLKEFHSRILNRGVLPLSML